MQIVSSILTRNQLETNSCEFNLPAQSSCGKSRYGKPEPYSRVRVCGTCLGKEFKEMKNYYAPSLNRYTPFCLLRVSSWDRTSESFLLTNPIEPKTDENFLQVSYGMIFDECRKNWTPDSLSLPRLARLVRQIDGTTSTMTRAAILIH